MTWQLYLIPNKDIFYPKELKDLEGKKSIEASVPGNFELDMYKAGLIDDPYFGTNTLKMQKLENLHLIYTTTFDNPYKYNKKLRTILSFKGIDTISHIYVNGKILDKTNNMFLEYEYEVDGLLKGKDNELLVHILPVTIESRKHELTPLNYALRYTFGSLSVRKAASMFGWDIMPRIVSGGLWKPVSLLQKPREYIDDTYIYTLATDPANKSAFLKAFYSLKTDADLLDDLRIEIKGTCQDSTFHLTQKLFHTYGTIPFSLENCKLWYPKNAGDQNLYDIEVSFYRDQELLDKKNFRIGIRTCQLIRTSTTDKEGNGDFCFKINGKKVFALGTNWVPLDAFHSQDDKRLVKALDLLDDIGCNTVRCWGGNVYENTHFFDFCDEKGIMVWQDFAMGCGVYPQDDKFQEDLAKEAAFIIKKFRNHPSLVLWAGDNECDIFQVIHLDHCDPNQNVTTRRTLFDMCRQHDPIRPYLPSSPYIDQVAFDTREPISEDHLWGPRDYFKGDFYRNSVCHFASETGYHGCPSPKSLEKYISKDKLWPMFDEKGETLDEWQVHSACMESEPGVEFSYRIRLMAKQVETLFGKLPDNLETFAYMSQISQAEAKKYFIERFRLSKWRRTGIIWWNLLDGWPQISDAVVDYYYVKKLAYHYIKRSQEPLCLMFDEPTNNEISLYGVNDTSIDKAFSYSVIRHSDKEIVLSGKAIVEADSSKKLASIIINQGEKDFYLIKWEDKSGKVGINHYFTNVIDIDYDYYMSALKDYKLDDFEGF